MPNIPKYVYIIAGVFVLAILIILLRVISKKRAKNKEIQKAISEKIRDDNLNSVILNSHYTEKEKKNSAMPYEVNYQGNVVEQNGNSKHEKSDGNYPIIQLVETTALSSRKFVFTLSEGITIGSENDNDIVIINKGVDEKHCSFFAVKKKVFVKNLADRQKTIIRRKNNQAIVDSSGIEVKSGDIIILGDVSYTVIIK